MKPGAEGHYGLFQDTEDGVRPMGCSNVSRNLGRVIRSEVRWLLKLITYPYFAFCRVCTLSTTTESEHTSHGDNQQPKFPAAFMPVAGVTAPPFVCQLPVQHFCCQELFFIMCD